MDNHSPFFPVNLDGLVMDTETRELKNKTTKKRLKSVLKK